MSTDDQSENDSFESAYNTLPTETPVAQKVAPTPAEKPVDQMKDVLDRLDKFQKSHDTLSGHIGGLTRNQNELRQLLAAGQTATNGVSNAPTQAEVKNAITDPQDWASLKSQYPEWAAATENIIDAKVKSKMVDQVAIDKIVAQRVAEETGRNRSEMIDSHLDSIVDTDWKKIVTGPEFTKWIGAQTPEVQSLGASDKMTDAARMLRLFEASKANPEPAQRNVTLRQKRIEAAIAPRGAGGHSSGPNTEEDYMTDAYKS